jgi:hypothetical protein
MSLEFIAFLLPTVTNVSIISPGTTPTVTVPANRGSQVQVSLTAQPTQVQAPIFPPH